MAVYTEKKNRQPTLKLRKRMNVVCSILTLSERMNYELGLESPP